LCKTHYEDLVEYINSGRFSIIKSFDIITSPEFPRAVTYEEFYTSHPILVRAVESMSYPEEFVSTLANIFFHAYCLHHNGEKFYHIRPQLAMNLKNTDINIDAHFLQSPFREIFIQIDPGLYDITDVYTLENWPVTGFYVNLLEKTDCKEIRIMATAKRPKKSNSPVPSGDFDDSIFYFKLYIKPGKIQDSVKDTIKNLRNGHADAINGGEHNIDNIEKIFNFVLNTLLYITSKDPDIVKLLPYDFLTEVKGLKNPVKKRKVLARAAKHTAKEILVIGQKVLSPYAIHDKKTGEFQWQLDKRVFVSGHWRVQWYGTDKDNTKIAKVIYIEPYEKGPEFAEQSGRHYHR